MTENLSGGRSGDVFGERDGVWRGDRASGGLKHVVVRIDAGELRALEQRVEERRGLSAALGARAVVILPPDHDLTAILPMSG